MCVCVCVQPIGILLRVFANGPGDRGLIPGQVIPKTLKMLLDKYLTLHYKVRIKGKWSNPGKGVAPSPIPQCSSCGKKEPAGHPRLRSVNLLYMYHKI